MFGLAIGGFGIGVRASVADVTIAGNYLGLDASGTVGNGNTYGVQLLDAPRAQVGGAAAADRNVISANTSNGVLVSGAGSAGVRVQGNLVGLSADEASAIGNVVGISISTSASDSFVGTDGDGMGDATEGNVVAGNSNRGIVIDGASNVMVAGNKVGVASDGMTEFANASGVATVASATNFLIGTNGDGISDRLERNLITGNTGNGITLQDSSGGIVAGNLVIGNGNDGLLIFSASGVTVGGPLASQRNVFSDNDSGVVVDGAAATGNKIFGNYIGLDETGLNPLPNTFGVLFTSDAIGNFLGTDGDGVNDEREGNVIACQHGLRHRNLANGDRKQQRHRGELCRNGCHGIGVVKRHERSGAAAGRCPRRHQRRRDFRSGKNAISSQVRCNLELWGAGRLPEITSASDRMEARCSVRPASS